MKNLIFFLLVSLSAQGQSFQIKDIYKFATDGDSTIIWEFSPLVVRKSWKQEDKPNNPMKQEKLIVSSLGLRYEDDEMAVIRYIAGDGYIDIVYGKDAAKFIFIAVSDGVQISYYRISKTIVPKQSNDTMRATKAQNLRNHLHHFFFFPASQYDHSST